MYRKDDKVISIPGSKISAPVKILLDNHTFSTFKFKFSFLTKLGKKLVTDYYIWLCEF